MMVSEGSLPDYVIAFCDVMATIKAHASSGSMLSPCDRRVGRPSIPHSPDLPTPLIYQLRN